MRAAPACVLIIRTYQKLKIQITAQYPCLFYLQFRGLGVKNLLLGFLKTDANCDHSSKFGASNTSH
jgi:hypothetical protein